MYNDVIILLKQVKTKNECGDTEVSYIENEVFCRVTSIGQSEFYQANTSGLKPEIKFVLSDYFDYDNQKDLIYSDKKYKVLRTYQNGNEMEITCYSEVV